MFQHAYEVNVRRSQEISEPQVDQTAQHFVASPGTPCHSTSSQHQIDIKLTSVLPCQQWQGKSTWEGKARGEARQGKASQGKSREVKAKQTKASLSKASQGPEDSDEKGRQQEPKAGELTSNSSVCLHKRYEFMSGSSLYLPDVLSRKALQICQYQHNGNETRSKQSLRECY
eukprot:16452350-Heterocapsa_arctica.AAC.1